MDSTDSASAGYLTKALPSPRRFYPEELRLARPSHLVDLPVYIHGRQGPRFSTVEYVASEVRSSGLVGSLFRAR
ncbi:unnamed protein product [Penicillium camemberti]|uniref:Str. FM013 n=1 Tax=Penicillium camemberti (strain FM 013) TaxID=1429867 RepID=A0A0G4P3R0_PENC3|nr:unnamed protein product [Penicillium camemberti]